MADNLNSIYKKLYSAFGKQYWWPAEAPFEVMVGAILTQSTSWLNVEKAINNLKKNRVLKPELLNCLPKRKLASLIRPAGYYNIKAGRLKNFLDFFSGKYKNNMSKMRKSDLLDLRNQLLAVNGIGPETADSILLYALNKPIFVVDAYTKRIFSRHKLIGKDSTYEEIQNLFMKRLRKDVKLFNEYHALLVRLGKDFCRKNNPKCKICPLN